jgi:hypothetical protein
MPTQLKAASAIRAINTGLRNEDRTDFIHHLSDSSLPAVESLCRHLGWRVVTRTSEVDEREPVIVAYKNARGDLAYCFCSDADLAITLPGDIASVIICRRVL